MRADLGVGGIKGGATVSWSIVRVSEVFKYVAYSVANVNYFCTFFQQQMFCSFGNSFYIQVKFTDISGYSYACFFLKILNR